MNSGGCFNQSNVVWPTIICSLIFAGLKMLRDAILDTILLFFVIQTNDCIVECLDGCGCWQINFMGNGLMLEESIFYFYFNKCKGSVSSLQFDLSNLCKSLFVAILNVVIASICASFDNLLLFSLRRTGTLRAHSCCFLLLMKLWVLQGTKFH